MSSRSASTDGSTRSTPSARCSASRAGLRRRPMPTFIPARGRTLHLAGVCVNRIGTEEFFVPIGFPIVLEETHSLRAPQDYVDILVGHAVLVGSENAAMLGFLLEGRDASGHGREFGRAPF